MISSYIYHDDFKNTQLVSNSLGWLYVFSPLLLLLSLCRFAMQQTRWPWTAWKLLSSLQISLLMGQVNHSFIFIYLFVCLFIYLFIYLFLYLLVSLFEIWGTQGQLVANKVICFKCLVHTVHYVTGLLHVRERFQEVYEA